MWRQMLHGNGVMSDIRKISMFSGYPNVYGVMTNAPAFDVKFVLGLVV